MAAGLFSTFGPAFFRCCQSSPKVDNPSHSVLQLNTGNLSQNEVAILRK